MSQSETELLEKEQQADLEAAKNANTLDLGTPDFSSILDDDEPEITSGDLVESEPKAKKGLKPSFVIRKFMPMCFAMIAKRKGEHWMLEDEEVDEFADSFDECIEHYYPELDGLPPWAMLATSTFCIFAPRLMMNELSPEEKQMLEKELQSQDEQAKGDNTSVIGEGTVLKPKAVN